MKHRTSVLNIAILVLVFAVAGAAQSTEIDSRDLLAEAEQVLRDQKMFELFNNCRAVPVLADLASEGDVEFQRGAFINASGGIATTWKHGRIGTHAGDGDYILQSVGIAVDNFVLEYLRVNEEACGRPPD